jgi:D-lactate dehydrogenase (cytochrome)
VTAVDLPTGTPRGNSLPHAAELAELAELAAGLTGEVSTRPADLDLHGRDENHLEGRPPRAVVFAESRDDVVTTMRWADRHGVAVIPFGTGTSAEGHVVPLGGEVTLDVSRMDRLVALYPEDFRAVVQPGLTRQALNDRLRGLGLTFPVDPGADASLGGMAATNASGTTTIRYGGMRANTLAMEVVLADGQVLRVGRPVRKSSSGYDLRDLFVGSAGTLGVITELTVALHPVPEEIAVLRAFFADIGAAVAGAFAAVGAGLPIARLELLDEITAGLLAQDVPGLVPDAPALFVELHSASAAGLEMELADARQALLDAGATTVTTATRPEERAAIWDARHRLFWSIRRAFPGRRYLITDTAVPLSAIADHARVIGELRTDLGLDVVTTGHVGDGNIHTVVAVAEGQDAPAALFSDELVKHALRVGGTCTGEHGIGVSKRKYLAAEHGEAAVWMARIKSLFDPRNLLNPGKIVGPDLLADAAAGR